MGKAPNFGLVGVQICSESCVALGKLLTLSEPQQSHQRRVLRGPEHWYRIAGALGSQREEQPDGICGVYPKKLPLSCLLPLPCSFLTTFMTEAATSPNYYPHST